MPSTVVATSIFDAPVLGLGSISSPSKTEGIEICMSGATSLILLLKPPMSIFTTSPKASQLSVSLSGSSGQSNHCLERLLDAVPHMVLQHSLIYHNISISPLSKPLNHIAIGIQENPSAIIHRTLCKFHCFLGVWHHNISLISRPPPWDGSRSSRGRIDWLLIMCETSLTLLRII